MSLINGHRNKVFWIIRDNVQKKHPDWSSKRVFAVTEYCFKKNTKQNDWEEYDMYGLDPLTRQCVYKTPCGLCVKFDKKCDEKPSCSCSYTGGNHSSYSPPECTVPPPEAIYISGERVL